MPELLSRNDMTKEQKELSNRGFSFDEKGKIVGFNGTFFAMYIRDNYYIKYSNDGNFYEYDSGVWKVFLLNELKAFLYEVLQEPRMGVWSTGREKEYIESMKRLLIETKEFNSCKHLINMKNGMYDTIRNKLIPHDPKYLSTIQLSIQYDEKARCPRFDQFLDEVFERDEERKTKAIEWYGYCLSNSVELHKALILYGGGRNGKGIYTDILTMIIGKENLSHVALSELGKSFSRATLYGKAVNITTETEIGGKSLNTQYFKAITGVDSITAEFKNQPVFSFVPSVKMVISMNNLPSTKDRSTGFFDRLDFLHFSRYFTKDERDSKLLEKLEAELPGIFNLATKGLGRLKKNGFKMAPCKSSDALLGKYKEELNPIIRFFDDYVEVAENDYRQCNKAVYNAFKNWANDNGHKGFANISTNKFWTMFEAEAEERGIETEGKHSDRFRYHLGIRLIEDHPNTKYKKIKRKVKTKPLTDKIDEIFEDDE